uniref:spermatogenesis-associated protein 17 isoform X3 n=1 Tax=Gasterosteus aculeatus aculeatus TaxID=481459 RepID=UPI001A984A3B|nr:spermatogenesis-associated protein 17 isoform X3 [Gasterosteus aculeatus aculeatus]
MAELLKIQSKVDNFRKEYFFRNSQAEENRQRENQAATRIQSWFRACKVQAYLSHLHKKAIIIQKIWRGFTARARFRQMVKAAYFIMKMNFYEEMAVRIQRRWRGFFVRKYVHNFYERKRYLEGLSWKNELVRKLLWRVKECRKRPGVFNSPFRPAPHEMELLLRQVKYQTPTRRPRRERACPLGVPDPTASSFPGTPRPPWIDNTGTHCSSGPSLPPIAIKKQQVWLREPGAVWEQRVHCPDLRLRLQTSYTHLEKAQNQLRQRLSVTIPTGTLGTGSILHHPSHSRNSPIQSAASKSFR